MRAAALGLGISVRSVRRALDRVDLLAIKLGNRIAVDRSSFERYRDSLSTFPGDTVHVIADQSASPSSSDHTLVPLFARSSSTLPPLPVPLSSFIGREDIIGSVADTLSQPQTRLLTLTWPGGVGKTRLALKVANELQRYFSDGVGFIDLAAGRSSNLVLPAIAHRLGVREGFAIR